MNNGSQGTSRFFPSQDGLTVHEPGRSLHWSRGDIGDGLLTFNGAQAAIRKLNADAFAGFSDWRMPTVEELFLLADRSCFSPAIDIEAFPTCADASYWSETLDVDDPSDYAWVVRFFSGHSDVEYRCHDNRVRAVRGAKAVSA